MTDRPILFSAPMVRALLDSRKTQTRRALYGERKAGESGELPPSRYLEEYLPPNLGLNKIATLGTAHLIQPGDRLWVKETWRAGASWDDKKPTLIQPLVPVDYLATPRDCGPVGKTRVSIFMPRWASRLTLIVTDVRIERLNDCTETDAIAEGAYRGKASGRIADSYAAMSFGEYFHTGRGWYRDLWNRINGAGAWEANPWVVAITFTVEQRNIDA